MNRAIRRISIATLVLFVVLMINVNYLQVFRVNSLASEAYNARIFSEQLKNQRGEIIAAGGPSGPDLVIAKSKQVKGGYYKRVYPAGREYAPVTGYDSILATTSPFGQTGIEKAENKYLTGTASNLAVYNLKGLFTGKPKQGASVYLTISPRGSGRRVPGAGHDGEACRSRRDRPAYRRHPGHGVLSVVQPQRIYAHQQRKGRQERLAAPQGPGRPAAEPGHQRHVPAGVDVQADHEFGGVQDWQGRTTRTPPSPLRSSTVCPAATAR